MSKVLISCGFGAGWSTWADGDHQKAIAEYEPIIGYVEAGKPILSGEAKRHDLRILMDDNATWDEQEAWLHPDFRALVRQMMDALGMDYFYTGGAGDLTVEEVDGPYYIEEYDGSERIRTSEDFWK